ncbi:MAG: helix-turn-helix domain-containing protein [Nitrosopumilaceae archaeon]|nr:helix-turn-helix domain-containing protein [Nitrosopumilaceae archaeon]
MVFEKISIVKGRKYKSLVKGYRDQDGNVKHKVIKYLGAVEPVNKRKNPNAGRKPKLQVRKLNQEERDFVKQNLKNSSSFIKDRTRIITLSNKDKTIKQISEQLGFHRPKIEKIIKEFNEKGLEIFKRKYSPGKPRRINKEERALILQYLNTEPEKLELHFNNWSHKKIANYARQEGINISPSQVRRIIKQDEIKYKKKTPWLFSNDPEFAKKKL